MYDALRRLTAESITSAVGGSRNGSWACDAAGSKTRLSNKRIVAYDVFNRLVQTPYGQWRYNAVGLLDEGTSTIGRRFAYEGLNVLHIGNATTLQHRYTFGPTSSTPSSRTNSPTVYLDPLGEPAIQYNALIRRNPVAMCGGAMAGKFAASCWIGQKVQ